MAGRMIYDCFLFNDELDLLQLRLSFLDDVVDRFLLVESPRTLSGKPKPLYFAENKNRFDKYLHKIIHIVAPANDMPPWEYEFFQRNYIKTGLIECHPDDLVAISDADEILNIKELLKTGDFATPALVELPVYYYYLNVKTTSSFRVNLLAKWSFIKDKDLGNRNENFPKWTKLISQDKLNTGWHFSYCYGTDILKYQEKIRSFSHQEYNTGYYQDPARIADCVSNSKDLFGRESIKLFREENNIDILLPHIKTAGLEPFLKKSFDGRFSVILPNYNHGQFLEKRIESILGQEYSDFELIILDDASTDNSREIINAITDHRITTKKINNKNSGSPFHQWAEGIRLSQHQYIWIAESDDLADPAFLKLMAGKIQDDPLSGIFYCDSIKIEPRMNEEMSFARIKNGVFNTNKWSSEYRTNGWEELNESLKLACTINNASACIFRKDLLLSILDELPEWQHHGDWYCYIKSAFRSPVHYLPQSLNEVLTHDMNFTSRKDEIKSNIEHFRILQLLLSQNNITGKSRMVRIFCEQYLGLSFRKQGLRKAFKTIALYYTLDPALATRVTAIIIGQRFTRKKFKPVF